MWVNVFECLIASLHLVFHVVFIFCLPGSSEKISLLLNVALSSVVNLNRFILSKWLFAQDNILIQSEEWQFSVVCGNLSNPQSLKRQNTARKFL